MQDLSRHLKEAIEINTDRMPRYAELSEGKTIPFSKKLIRYERLSLWGAWIFDRIGDKYQRQGIPYMKSEFVEMSLTPDFSPNYPEDIDYRLPLQRIDLQAFSKNLKNQIKHSDFEGIVNSSNEVLHDLEQQPHVYCMLRHIIESLRRIAFLIPIHEAKCENLKIKPPTSWSAFLIRTHRWTLNQSVKLDEAIAPIQQSGIPILFQDLPHINLELE